jgi:hypothetical protein
MTPDYPLWLIEGKGRNGAWARRIRAETSTDAMLRLSAKERAEVSNVVRTPEPGGGAGVSPVGPRPPVPRGGSGVPGERK